MMRTIATISYTVVDKVNPWIYKCPRLVTYNNIITEIDTDLYWESIFSGRIHSIPCTFHSLIL
jgi:hypothetical protein